MLKFFVKNNDFLISNFETLKETFLDWNRNSSQCRVFGYCFYGENYIKNSNLSIMDFNYIKKNNIDISGIFCALKLDKNRIEICLDPLAQFNLFFYKKNGKFTLSSSLEMMRLFHGLKDVDEGYLFDQLAYQSPLRAKTIFKDVKFLRFDDLYFRDRDNDGILSFLENFHVAINIPQYKKYKNYSYSNLLKKYIERLETRAKIISQKFDEVHLQLTGGADSRLALSALQKYKNIKCYVYGDGSSQNRLIFEELLKMEGMKPVDCVKTIGAPISNPSRMIRGLIDMNYMKFNNVNTYMNGKINSENTICKVTGYYGANVSGGVVLPPENTSSNRRLEKIPSNLFTYHEYVQDFKSKYNGLRASALADRFYINNRGKSHYAAHSLADNKYINSVDILYDFINLMLVEKCPYKDSDINKCAITIDLIYEINPRLALFPYDNRQIPKYRNFRKVPKINCFDGYQFSEKHLESFSIVYPEINDKEFNILNPETSSGKLQVIFNHELVREHAKFYPDLEYLTKLDDIQAEIFLYFLLAKIKIRQGNV